MIGSVSHIKRGILLVLLLSLFLSLVSCEPTQQIVREGLTVLPSDDTAAPYSADTLILGREAIFGLLSHYVRTTTTVPTLAAATTKTLQRHAAMLATLLSECGLTEVRYREVAALLRADGPAAIDAYLSEGGGLMAPKVKALYLSLSERMGAERLGRFAYAAILYLYEDKAATALSRYESYGYPHLLVEAERLSAERAVLVSDVGEKDFVAAMRLAVMLADLAAGTASGEQLSAFSPTELLLFLRYVPLEDLTLAPKGWELLLSFAVPSSGEGYRDRLLIRAEENGDLTCLSTVLNTAIPLLASVRDGMTEEEARLLQKKDTGGLLYTIFHRMSAGEKETLFALLATPFTYAEYEAIAEEKYGDAFGAYRQALTAATAEELCAADAEEFSSVLERYLFGISPVLTYREEN